MLDAGLDWVAPILEGLLKLIATYLLARVAAIAPAFMKAYIDRIRQEALHRGVATAVNLLLEVVDKGLSYNPATAGLVKATDHVWNSSSGILRWFFKRHFDEAQAHILKLIRSRLVELQREDVIAKIDEEDGWSAPAVPVAAK